MIRNIIYRKGGVLLSKLFDRKFLNPLELIEYNNLQEIRMKVNSAVILQYDNNKYFLSQNGVTKNMKKAIISTYDDLKNIVKRASNFSLYTVENEISSGYITTSFGVRVGLCGSVVNNLKNSIIDFSSLIIRIPHEVKNCAQKLTPELIQEDFVQNSLIVSRPGAGKTTLLRDIVFQLSNILPFYNICVIDEKKEIAPMFEHVCCFDLGANTHILSGGDKSDDIMMAIRNLSPQCIVTDEIGTVRDIDALLYAASCGVSIISSIHANNIEDLLKKESLSKLFEAKIFKRIVFLSKKNKVGEIINIFDEDFNVLYGV